MTNKAKPRGRLLLARKRGESIWIGDVRVTIHKFERWQEGSPMQVKLVIEGPKEIPVLREEIVAEGNQEYAHWWQDTGGEAGGA